MRRNIFCLLFILPLLSVYGQITTLAHFPLPATYKNGPVDLNFSFTYSLSIKTLGTTKELWLKMKTTFSPGTSGGFYKYRYQGKEFNNAQIGMNGFNSITMGSASFYISVAGPGFGNDKSQVLYETFLGEKKLGNVPKDAEASSYSIFFVSLKSIYLNGTSGIENSIAAYIANSKKQTGTANGSKTTPGSAEKKETDDSWFGDASGETAAPKSNSTSSGGKGSSGSRTKPNGKAAAGGDDDFWSDTQPSSAGASREDAIDRSALPKYVQSKESGEYYEKDENNNYRKISRQAFEAGRRAEAAAKGQRTAAPKKSNEEILSDFKQQQQKSTDDFFNGQAEIQRKGQVLQTKSGKQLLCCQDGIRFKREFKRPHKAERQL